MTAPEPDRIVWHTSSYSTSNGGCVEVAPAPGRVLVRDSKDPHGPALTVPTPTWQAFLTPWRRTVISIHVALQEWEKQR